LGKTGSRQTTSLIIQALKMATMRLKKELVRKQIFYSREVATSKIFEYIEMFYNPKRRHSYLNYLSPNEFEKKV